MHARQAGKRKLCFTAPVQLVKASMATDRLHRAAPRTPNDIVHVGKNKPIGGIAACAGLMLGGTPFPLDLDNDKTTHGRFGRRWEQRIVA